MVLTCKFCGSQDATVLEFLLLPVHLATWEKTVTVRMCAGCRDEYGIRVDENPHAE